VTHLPLSTLAKENKIIGMNASGRAPYSANLEWFKDKGIKIMPERGILSVTVPGGLAWMGRGSKALLKSKTR